MQPCLAQELKVVSIAASTKDALVLFKAQLGEFFLDILNFCLHVFGKNST